MELTFDQVKGIVATLPIGYYLGKGTSVTLTREADTYANMEDGSIHISYPTIVQTMRNSKAPDSIATCRALVYHEISHLILTPKNLKSISYSKEENEAINIFEDERIETLLAEYYMGTNFKRFKFEFNGVDPENISAPNNALEAFYNIVRFHHGEAKYFREVFVIIDRYQEITSTKCMEMPDYRHAIVNLFEKIKKDFEEKNPDKNENSNESKDGQGDGQSDGQSDGKESVGNKKIEQLSEQDKREIESLEKDLSKSLGLQSSPTSLRDRLSKVTAKIFHRSNTALYESIQKIIEESLKRKRQLSGNRYSYDGRIDPLRVADPSSRYKWFEKMTDDKHGNGGDKLRLNLWVDCSSSFKRSESIINELIGALVMLEATEPRFELNVVRCDIGEKILDKNNRFVKCDSGNSLSEKVFTIYKKLNAGMNANIQNLVVFDGRNSMFGTEKNNAGFNHSNVYVISDVENEKAFREYAPMAKKTFCKTGYAELLTEKALETLKQMFR